MAATRKPDPAPSSEATAAAGPLVANAEQDANVTVNPHVTGFEAAEAPQASAAVQRVAASAVEGGETVLVVGEPGDDGRVASVRVQPFGVQVGHEIPTQAVAERSDVYAIYVEGNWITAPVDRIPLPAAPPALEGAT